MNTLKYGNLVINIEINKVIRDSEGYPEDTRPPLKIIFRSCGEILFSVGASSDDDIIECVGEYVLRQRGIPLGGKYPELFRAIGNHALETGRGDILLEPIFNECGMVKSGGEYILPNNSKQKFEKNGLSDEDALFFSHLNGL